MMDYSQDPNYLQTAGRALDILKLFQKRAYLSLTDISKITGLSVSIAYRLLHTLCVHGFLDQTKSRKLYCLGEQAMLLGQMGLYGHEMAKAAGELVQQWYTQTGHSISIMVQISKYAINIRRISPLEDDLDMVYVGVPSPLHLGASQRVLLANMMESEQQAYVDDLFLDEKAKAALLEELKRIKERGYDYTEEQVTKGFWAMAIPIFYEKGQLAGAVASMDYIAGSTPEQVEERLRLLKELARKVQDNMDRIRMER